MVSKMTREEKNLTSILGAIRRAAVFRGVDLNTIIVTLTGNVLRIECKLHAGYLLHMSLDCPTIRRDHSRLIEISFSDFLRGTSCPPR